MPYVTVEEEIWVDLDDFETQDLIDELKSRNANIGDAHHESGVELLQEIYMAKHVRKLPYDHLIDKLIGVGLGRIL